MTQNQVGCILLGLADWGFSIRTPLLVEKMTCNIGAGIIYVPLGIVLVIAGLFR
ncbi:hypothetical protein [Haladaptatus halobius]|uniref:hypothetical protein n=1 Tax=Haladaptatus halobius TaxID=2884875 RepID=UPI001D0AD729|nr:hypothetical protein [Haladaptatus halobius]